MSFNTILPPLAIRVTVSPVARYASLSVTAQPGGPPAAAPPSGRPAGVPYPIPNPKSPIANRDIVSGKKSRCETISSLLQYIKRIQIRFQRP